MEITARSLWTLIHGMGFGALYLLACSGALVELYRRYCSPLWPEIKLEDERFLRIYLTVMAVLAWLAVLTGAYIIYPWYRAVPPPGTSTLAEFSQRLLLSGPSTSAWHSIGMEWKEHVAWLVPISITMAAVVSFQYGRNLRDHPQLRRSVFGFVWISLLAAGIAGFFGAMLNKNAPVEGGSTIHIIEGGQP
jgi:membrane peptidoglycan carboxypeptidase